MVAAQKYNFEDPPINIKILNSGVGLPPRYGRAELTLVRIAAKQKAGTELTDEEKRWVQGAEEKDEKGKKVVVPGTGMMRKLLDKHYDLVFWKSPHAARMNAKLIESMAKPQYNITVADQNAGKTTTVKVEEKTAPTPGGKSA